MCKTKFVKKTCVCVSQLSAQPGDNQTFPNIHQQSLIYKAPFKLTFLKATTAGRSDLYETNSSSSSSSSSRAIAGDKGVSNEQSGANKTANELSTTNVIRSQRIFLLRQLRAQGMPLEQLHTVFQAITLQRLAYALPAWGPFLSVDLKHKIDGFLKRSHRYGFTKEIFHIQTITDSVTYDLFNKVKASNHCLYHLLPPQRPLHDALRVRGHQFQLPNCIYKFHKQ